MTTNLSSKKPHSEDIKCLPLHILCAHINDTLQTKPSTNSCCCNSMLTSSSFSNNPLFAQPLGKQSLGNGIVDLVSPSMIQIFSLEVNEWTFTIGTLIVLRQPLCKIKRSLPPYVVFQDPIQFFLQNQIFPL